MQSTQTHRLIYVKARQVVDVPPVCTVFWTRESWIKWGTRAVCEPLVLDCLGDVYVATGERNERGQLLYERGRGSEGAQPCV